MAHMVETMAYAGAIPWHGLGTEVPEEAGRDLRGFQIAAGLNWSVELIPLFTADGVQVERKAVRRTSDNSILGTVGMQYRAVQNDEAFDWFAPFIEAGEAKIHTAGSLKDGARVWVLAKLNREPMIITGTDAVDKYVLLSHSHDGSLSVRAGFTPIRVVCNNTLTMAHSSAASKLIRVRHTRSVMDNLAAIRDVMNLADEAFAATAEQYRKLAHKDINQKDIVRYVELVFGFERDEFKGTLNAKAQKVVDEVIRLAYEGIGNEAVAGTYWAAYNGVNEYLNYSRGRSADNRLDSLWFGAGANLNERALKVAVEMAA